MNPDPHQRDADPQHFLEETSDTKTERFTFSFSKILLNENMYNNSGHGHGLRIRQKKTLGLPKRVGLCLLFIVLMLLTTIVCNRGQDTNRNISQSYCMNTELMERTGHECQREKENWPKF